MQIVPFSETFSYNGEFKLVSKSYDDSFPNLKGESFVYYKANPKEIYKINRSFDLYDGYPFFCAISNDGRKIIYIHNEYDDETEESKNVTFYVDGKLVKAFKTDEFLKCDLKKGNCNMFYFSNIDNGSELNDKSLFLKNNFVLNHNDTIYITDSREKVSIFDLNNGELIKSNLSFDSIYNQIKDYKKIEPKISYYQFPYNNAYQLISKENNEDLLISIGKLSKLKYTPLDDPKFSKYKQFFIQLNGYLDFDGNFEIEKINMDSIFDESKIKNFINSTKFQSDFITESDSKIYMTLILGGYRDFKKKIAKKMTNDFKILEENKRKKRFTDEYIDGIYIPIDMYECMIELDKLVDYELREKLLKSEDLNEFNSHTGGLGMWIRNNWSINGGSRLLIYFLDRNVGNKIFGNDDISKNIIEQYLIWLKGDKNAWKKWEENNTKKINH